MKTILTLILVFVAAIAFSQDVKQQQPQKKKTETTVKKDQPKVEYVYICNGPSSTKYHKTSNCRGLSRCSTEIEKIGKPDAVKKDRTACKICYK